MTPEERREIENIRRQSVGIIRACDKVLGNVAKPDPQPEKTMAEMVSEHAAKTFGTG